MIYEESYQKAFPFDKMVPGMLNSEMVEDTAKIVNEAIKVQFRSTSSSITAPAGTPP